MEGASMRNAVQRRNHRERGQPEERAKWGLLEKKKDYSARARDFNAKKAKLKALKQKVDEKNPDEFYHAMMSRKGPTSIGKHRTGTLNGDRGFKTLSQDAVRLLKTQDMGYVRTERNKARKVVDALEKSAVGIIGSGKKIVFVDGEEEQLAMLESDMIEEDDEDEDEDEEPEDRAAIRAARDRRRAAEKLEKRLEASRKRLEVLTEAEEALDLQRAKMGKTHTIGGVTKQGIKFKGKRERKR